MTAKDAKDTVLVFDMTGGGGGGAGPPRKGKGKGKKGKATNAGAPGGKGPTNASTDGSGGKNGNVPAAPTKGPAVPGKGPAVPTFGKKGAGKKGAGKNENIPPFNGVKLRPVFWVPVTPTLSIIFLGIC